MKKPILSTLVVAVSLALLPFLWGCTRETPATDNPKEPPREVQVVHPIHGEIARTVTLPAFRILAEQEATLYAKVSGT